MSLPVPKETWIALLDFLVDKECDCTTFANTVDFVDRNRLGTEENAKRGKVTVYPCRAAITRRTCSRD
jgi:hypothetical protein